MGWRQAGQQSPRDPSQSTLSLTGSHLCPQRSPPLHFSFLPNLPEFPSPCLCPWVPAWKAKEPFLPPQPRCRPRSSSAQRAPVRKLLTQVCPGSRLPSPLWLSARREGRWVQGGEGRCHPKCNCCSDRQNVQMPRPRAPHSEGFPSLPHRGLPEPQSLFCFSLMGQRCWSRGLIPRRSWSTLRHVAAR